MDALAADFWVRGSRISVKKRETNQPDADHVKETHVKANRIKCRCGVWSVKCGVWSGKCRVWCVKCCV